MSYDPKEGIQDGVIEEFLVTTSTTHNQGEPVALDTSTGKTVVPSAAASRRFLGWCESSKVVGDGTLKARVRTGPQTRTNLVVVGTGGSGVLVQADIGKDVFVTGANAYTVVPAANQMRVGALTAIRSAGTSNDGRGDVRWEGLGPEVLATSATAITTLTDSTGASGTHDDTLADGLTAAALTENSGAIGGSNDGDLPDLTATTHALTDNTGGTPSTTAIANLADGTTYANDHAAIENNFATLAAEHTLLRADIATLVAAVREVATMVNTCVTDLTTQNQNDSDNAQKIIEIINILEANNLAI